MQRYLCAKCKGVFCGWAVIHKLKYKCPTCGGKLKKINPDKEKNRKYRKVIRDHNRGRIINRR